MTTPPGARTGTTPLAAAAVSGHLDTRTAAMEVASDVFDHLGGGCDLAILFGSFHHIAAFSEAADSVRQTISPRCMLGVTAESVLGSDQELEGLAGLSLLAMRLPGAQLNAWRFDGSRDARVLASPDAARDLLGVEAGMRTVIILADPFTTPVTRLLPAMAECAGQDQPVRVIGGLASGASQPGQNRLVIDEQVIRAGAVGVTLGGAVDVDMIVSQGCRPIDRPIVITKAEGNVIQELGGRKAFEFVQEMAGRLPPADRELLGGGMLVGTVIDEYKARFGRGDFLVRNILGIDKDQGAIAVGDVPRVGQTIQFHVRDAETAHEDLQLLLDAQQLKEQPIGGVLFTCNGRGSRLFKDQDHDVQTIRQRLGDMPLAGFFAAGEIGPVGEHSFLHGHTASLGVFRVAAQGEAQG